MKKLALLPLLFLLVTGLLNAQSWTQVGQDIDGESLGDASGTSVSISADGSIVAIGANYNDASGDNSGHVRVYENISGVWTQIGHDIDGEAIYDQSGGSISLNYDGSIVAIGAINNNGNGMQSGHVRVYQNISGTWSQIGSDINGEDEYNWSGSSVSLNSDGSIVAIGAELNDGVNGGYSGHVRVYQNISGTWVQIGNDIDGEGAGIRSGHSVSLNSDGTIVAVGAHRSGGNGFYSGHVSVYQNLAGTWTQIGNDIDGEAAVDRSGSSVSLNSSGTIVAIGAPYNDGNGTDAGHVRIYQNNAGTWTQIGNDIDGEAADDFSGYSVSLNSNGSLVAIGARNNNGSGTDAGHVRIFENQSGTWVQIGNDIDGETAGDWSGYSVSLCSNGFYVAVSAIHNPGNSYQEGQVRVFDFHTSPNPPTAGDGSSGYPYQIATLNNLLWLSQNPTDWDKYYIQTADIDASSTIIWNSGSGFSPIGNSTTRFEGSYDGDGHTINRLFISLSTDDVGLFGLGWALLIENLGVTNVNITGNIHVGGILGFTYYGNVNNCYSTGNVSGNDQVGGLVGRITGYIEKSSSTAIVNGNDYIGGLLGFGFGYEVNNCYSKGNVTGVNGVGGLIGTINGDPTNCYSTGNVNGVDYIGGLIGSMRGDATNCYSSGDVNGTGSNVGGLIGSIVVGYTTITDCFWDTQTSGQTTSVGGTGKTTSEMKDVPTFTDLTTIGLTTSWDFVTDPNDDSGTDDIWDKDSDYNNGYPFFSREVKQLIWNGSAGSNWNTNDNWSGSLGKPSFAKNVIVPASPSGGNFPETNTGSGAECNNLTIEPGGHLYIPSDNTLTVNGILTNNAGTSGIIVKADNTGMGSLIQNTTNVQATVEQWLEFDAIQGWQWHLVSAPISNATINTYYDMFLYQYHEGGNAPGGGYWENLWDPVTTPMYVGEGYNITGSNTWIGTTTVTSEGTLNSSDVTITGFTMDDPDVNFMGFKLVGNPFPCALDWNTSVDWNRSGLSGWMVLLDDGTYRGYHSDGTSWQSGTNIIPSTQGFFVRATSLPASLTIPTSQRVHNGQDFYKGANDFTYPIVRIEAQVNCHTDESVIVFHPEGSTGFDDYYDLSKFTNAEGLPNLYSVSEGINYAFSFLQEEYIDMIIPVYFEMGISGICQIETTEIDNISQAVNVYLEDLIEGTITELKANPVYEFEHNMNNDPHRFNLHFKESWYGIEDNSIGNINIYSTNDFVYILTPEMQSGDLFIYDMLGQEILNQRIIKSDLTKIRITSGTAYYLVRFQLDETIVTEKVFIK